MAEVETTFIVDQGADISFNYSFEYGGTTYTFLIDEAGDPDSSVTDFSNYVSKDYIAYNPGTEDGTFKAYVGVYYDDTIKAAYWDGSHAVNTSSNY